MSTQIQLRRGLAALWTAINPTLAQGDVGLELDTAQIKIGDGETPWMTLPYFSTGIVASVAGRIGNVVLSASDIAGLASSATIDTTNASNITSGILNAARLPPSSMFPYVWTQSMASATWTIAHNLGRFPSVTVVDSSNQECEGAVDYLDSNNIVLSFSAPFSGEAFLN